MSNRTTVLFKDRSTTGESIVWVPDTDDFLYSVGGTDFDGATVSLQIQEQENWITVTNSLMTATGQAMIQGAIGRKFRAYVSGAGASTNIDVSVTNRY